MKRKKQVVSNNNNNENSISEISKYSNQYISQFFELLYLYIIWLYALRFVACKVSVDVFSLLIIQIVPCKVESICIWCHFCLMVWLFIRDLCLSIVKLD